MASSRDWPEPGAHTLLSLFSTHLPAKRDAPKPDHPLHPNRVPTRVLVLGVNERRVTVYSQQCTALNLVWLLHETHVLGPLGLVAVVGAGAGGLTAAAGAACKGHRVILLNKSLDAMPQQRFARHRWLHPRIFDLPGENWWKEDSDLPLLPWKADNADEVRRRIIQRFEAAPWRERVEYEGGVDHVVFVPALRASPKPDRSVVADGILSALRLEALPWWTAYGYATSRSDDAPTQLAFAHQLISLGSTKEAPGEVRETAYTALRRAIRCQRQTKRGDPEREHWVDALLTAGEFMTLGGDERMEAVGAEFETRWDLPPGDRAVIGRLFALRALEPKWPGWLRRLLYVMSRPASLLQTRCRGTVSPGLPASWGRSPWSTC